MKRTLALLLALLLALSLCACGGDTSADGDATSSPAETEHPAGEVALHLNENVTLGDFEFMITYARFVRAYTTYGSPYNISHTPDDGNIYLQVDYTVKNVSKEKQWTPLDCMSVNYDNGYTFEAEDTYRDLATYGSGVQNPEEMPPLSPAVDCRAYFSVPEEVYSSDKPLSIAVGLSDGDGWANASFDMRPMDETQQEAFYNAAARQMDEEAYASAEDLLDLIPDYADAAELLTRAQEMCRITDFGGAGSEEDVAYYTEKLPTYQKVSDEELAGMIVGKWYGFHTGEPWEIFADGTIDDNFDYPKYGWGDFHRTWKIEGDTLTISALASNGKEVFDTYEVYKVTEGAYLLTKDGVPYSSMLAR